MALAHSKPNAKRNMFGVSLAEDSAAHLRAEAERLDMPPTTLAARLLEAALKDRATLSGGSPPTSTGADNQVLAAVTALAADLRALGENLQQHQKPEQPSQPQPTGPGAREVLSALSALERDLDGLRRAHHNGVIKLLRAATDLSTKEIADWARANLTQTTVNTSTEDEPSPPGEGGRPIDIHRYR
jgi:hypothetical protein